MVLCYKVGAGGSAMSIEENIIKQIHELPDSKKSEVLDFVEYLRSKTDEKDWSAFSLSSAMRGMEDDDSLYTINDVKESSS
jgi:hypothetical protein